MKFPLWFHRFWQKLRRLANDSRPVLYRGIDVSEWNGAVNFNALQGKIDFALLRCGYGSDFSQQDDSCFAHNAQACTAAGIPYGVYLYSYAQNESMAQSEAAHVLRLLHGEDPDFGVWYDVEDKSLPFAAKRVPALCKTFCDILLAAGCTCVGVYAYLSDMEAYLSGPEMEPYQKWVAQWNWDCDYPKAGMWQFTDHAVFDGQGPFDMSYAYVDYLEMTGGNMLQQKFNQMMENYLAELRTREVSAWAKEAWDQACGSGMLDGTSPQSFVTREQAAVILQKVKPFLSQ